MKRLVLLAAVLHEALAASIASAAEPARIAVFDFELIDTSLQGEMAGADPADEARLRMIEAELRQRLEESGRFQLVDTAPAAAQIDAAGVLWSCNGCEVGIAAAAGRRARAGRLGAEGQQPDPQHQRRDPRHRDPRAGVRRQRRHPWQHRRELAARHPLSAQEPPAQGIDRPRPGAPEQGGSPGAVVGLGCAGGVLDAPEVHNRAQRQAHERPGGGDPTARAARHQQALPGACRQRRRRPRGDAGRDPRRARRERRRQVDADEDHLRRGAARRRRDPLERPARSRSPARGGAPPRHRHGVPALLAVRDADRRRERRARPGRRR